MPANILIVDDDELVRRLLTLHLTNAGYAVSAAEDAIRAGYISLQIAPDLIITDVKMPHMSGFDFIAALQSDPRLASTPVIFLTSDEDGDARARELGAAGYVNKPVRADVLLALVDRALKKEDRPSPR